MSLLPDGPIDTLGVRAAVDGTAEQIRGALATSVDVDAAATAGVLVMATADDSLVADAARTLVTSASPVPVVVHTGPDVPAFVTADWCCVFVGHGTTVAEPAVAAVGRTGCRLFAVGDGTVVDAVSAAGGVAVATPAPVASRFGFAGTLVATLRLLSALGAGLSDVEAAAAAAADAVERRRSDLDATGDDAALARRIGRTIPLIYGTGALGGLAARRWKNQVNDNAKAPAFANALPEVLHHELSGWGQHGDMTRQVFTLVTLRHADEDASDVAAIPALEALMEEVTADRHEVTAAGDGALAQLLDLVYLGDRVSYHLAQENEIDPGPVSTPDFVGTADG